MGGERRGVLPLIKQLPGVLSGALTVRRSFSSAPSQVTEQRSAVDFIFYSCLPTIRGVESMKTSPCEPVK